MPTFKVKVEVVHLCPSIPLSTSNTFSDTTYLETDGSDDEIRHAEESGGGSVEGERQERAEERTD